MMDPDTTPPTHAKKLINMFEDKFQKGDLPYKCKSMVACSNVNDSKESEKDKRFYDVQLTKTKELRALSNYTNEQTGNLQNLSNACSKMTFWDLVGDGMIPKEKRKWFHCFALKKSDKATILEKTQIFQKFYEDVHKTVTEATASGSVNCKDFREEINRLKTKVETEYETAKCEIKKTSSKLVYNMYETFISEYEKLNRFIGEIESAALSEMLTIAESGLKAALDEIDVLKAHMTEINDKMTELTNTNADLLKKFETSEANIAELTKTNADLVKKSETSEANMATLLQQNKEIMKLIKKQNSSPIEE